jgi:hypothetical protein
MAEPKYQLPSWLQAIWLATCLGLSAVMFLGARDTWVPIAFVTIAVLLGFTGLYNKLTTGKWVPGLKSSPPNGAE